PMKCMEHEKWEEGDRTLEFLKQVIRDCQAQGRFAGRDVDGLAYAIWSMVHGIASLFVRDRVQAFEGAIPEDLMKAGLRNFEDMLDAL
ncbi:MAG: WHG domain-containing protein, partial [Chitinophagaceae bacterium]